MFWIKRILSLALGIGFCFLIDIIAHRQDDYSQRLIVLVGLYITLSVSLNLINGITGQFSIGHAAFYQIGAYLAGYLSVTYYGLARWPQIVMVQGSSFSFPWVHFSGGHIPLIPWLIMMMVVSAAGAATAGFVVGLPSLRLRGDYLAIVTLGFGEIIRIIVQNQKALGGSYGMDVTPKIQPVWLIWLLAVLCIAVCRNLLKTAHGLPFLSVREDEVASSAMGVNVTRVKVTAFMIGSAFAGAAGALLAHYETFITPATFAMDVSFIILTMVVLGGTGSITGSIISAAFLSYLPEYLRGFKAATGGPLTMAESTVVAGLIAIAISVAVVKRIMDGGRGTPTTRGLTYVAAFAGAIPLTYLVAQVLQHVPKLADTRVEVSQLRMVIFAITLIILMLLRPQGIFAHHEFSWSWVMRLFGKRNTPTKEIAA